MRDTYDLGLINLRPNPRYSFSLISPTSPASHPSHPTPMQPLILTQITALLDLAGQAHHHYEQTVLNGVYDQDWPDWYADYALIHGLGNQLQRSPTAAELSQFLKSEYEAFKVSHPQESWATHTARQLIAIYGEQP